VNKTWTGPLVTGLIVVGVLTILILNFQPDRATKEPSKADPAPGVSRSDQIPISGGVRENPIGETVVKNHLQINSVWLAGVAMDGMSAASGDHPDVIHLEADIRSTEGNPNGFAKDEFVPYLKVTYEIRPVLGGPVIDLGELHPMIASDGLHYGASVAMPRPGHYRLIYRIEPPSTGGLGRHVGLGGVAPWWEPFAAEFDWSVEAPSPASLAGTR